MSINQNSAITSKAIAAAKAAALNLNNKYKLDNHCITMLPVSKLNVGKYQKELNIERVKRIVEKFDIHRMRPIEVSFRDGEYWVFDGQHRANAYYIMGIREIPCVIHKGLTYQEEAYLFARQQENVGSVNTNHKWNALREADDSETMEIIKLCKDWGFEVLQRNNRGNNIKCVKTLRDLYREFGPEKLGTILMCIKNAWMYMEHSTDVSIIGGIAKLLRVFPDRLDFNRLQDALNRTTPKQILIHMEDDFHGVRGEQRRAAFQIAKLYNKKLVQKNKLDISAI